MPNWPPRPTSSGLGQKDGESTDALLNEAFALSAKPVVACSACAFRCADDRRHGPATRARSPRCAPVRARPGRDPGGLPECAERSGVHVVTVNDYLARRDAGWMGRLYHFLGMSTGVINSSGGMGPDNSSYQRRPDHDDGDTGGFQHLRPVTRAEAYACDITYGTNNEFGFDYLRDNMAFACRAASQRRAFAVVDESTRS